jgi:hypothetical protein
MLEKYFEFTVEDVEIEHSSCFGPHCNMVKTASVNPLDEINQKKDHAYLHVIAMGAGDYYGENNNGDFFYEKDLRDYYKTFETAGVFVQHFNKDPSKSIGRVLQSTYNDKMHRVELIIEISKKKSPEHYEAIERGERIKVSMGVKVPQEMCSYCGAITKGSIANRCDHLKFMMHDQKENGQIVYAINMPPMNFFDISIVRKPADAQGHSLFQKVASDESQESELMDKIATLTKYMDAMKIMPPAVSDDELFSLRSMFSPETIKRIIIAKRIVLKPSEAMALGTSIPIEKMDECRNVCDNTEFLEHLLAAKRQEGCGMHEKYAAAIDYSNKTIDKLIQRTELVKLGAIQRNAFGRKKLTLPANGKHATVAVNKRIYPEYRINFINGDSATIAGNTGFTLRKSVPEYYLNLVEEGYAHNITGVLPSGDERVIYGATDIVR